MAERRVNWGIVGTGAVASNFADMVASVPGTAAVAVASSRTDKAAAFAAPRGIHHALASVEALAALPEVDVVYVASATHLHEAHALAALKAGKALLCEKPFGGSAGQAERIVGAAADRELFCMEAMWTRFNGAVRSLRDDVQGGALGAVSGAVLSLGYGRPAGEKEATHPDRSNLRNFGCYAISLSTFLFGPVTDWKATGRRNAAGIDTDLSLILSHGATRSLIDVSSTVTRANRLDVYGSRAVATIPASLINPALLLVRPQDRGGMRGTLDDLLSPLRARAPAARRKQLSGLRGQIEEVARCLREGRRESSVMPLRATLENQRLMDAIAASF